jgi:hypothetical protein
MAPISTTQLPRQQTVVLGLLLILNRGTYVKGILFPYELYLSCASRSTKRGDKERERKEGPRALSSHTNILESGVEKRPDWGNSRGFHL